MHIDVFFGVCAFLNSEKVKSEFMVALDTAEKQVQEYQTKLVALEEQLSKSGMFGLP